MKISLAGLVFLILSISNVFSAGDQLITELKIFQNDTTFRHHIIYSNKNKVLETVSFQLVSDDSKWTNFKQTEWIYNGNFCESRIDRQWMQNSWTNIYRVDFGQSGNESTEIRSSAITTGDLEPVYKKSIQTINDSVTTTKEYFYKSTDWSLFSENTVKYRQGKLYKSDFTYYQNSSVILLLSNVYSYNSIGKLSEMLTKQTENVEDTLKNYRLTNWYYKTGDTLLIYQKTREWDDVSGWVNLQSQEYTYADNRLIQEEIDYSWNVIYWLPVSRCTYDYDSDGDLAAKHFSESIYNKWRNTLSINVTNDEANKKQTLTSQYDFWGGEDGELVDAYIPVVINENTFLYYAKKIEMTYVVYTNSIDDQTYFVKVYPNPTTGSLYIQLPSGDLQQVTVTDLNGRTIKTIYYPEKTGMLDVSELSQGIYLLRIKINDQYYTAKISKI